MSFLIVYRRNSEGHFELFTDLSEREHPSPITYDKDKKRFIVGEYFDISANELFNSGWERNPKIINSSCSAICLVSFDAQKCMFISDNTGRELLFYFHSSDLFILSDNFWAIVEEINPSFKDIDGDIVKEMISTGCGVPADHTLPIKGMHWLGPNSLAEFDADSGKLFLTQFDQIQRTGEITEIDEAVEIMDSAMNHMAESIMSLLPNSVFGLGLSGGLDSRIALHYFKKNGADLACFNICTARPHKILLAHSVKRARDLANAANVVCKEVDWSPITFREKANRLLKEQPVGTGGHYTNLYKYESDGVPRFDYLITAGQGIGPYIVGVSAPQNSDEMSREDLIKWGLHLSHASSQPYPFTEHSIRKQLSKLGLNYIDTTKGRHYDLWKKIVDDETYARVEKKVTAFVDRDLNNGIRPADITLDFRTSTLGAIGRNGAYESLLNSYRNFTIYTPFLVKDGLKWDIPLVEERRILKELIKKKIPEFALIGEEEVGSISSKGRLSNVLNKAEFVLRGSGIMAEEWYRNNPMIRHAFLEDFSNDCTWFYEIAPAACDYETIWKMSAPRRNSIWELKRLIDCIERKDYKEFV